MTMISLMRRLMARIAASTRAAPSHAAPTMPSDWRKELPPIPSSGAPSRKRATPSEAPGADAQHIGTGQRVAEEGLHLETAGGECRACGECRDGLQQADLEDDVPRRGIAGTARQGIPHLCGSDGDRAHGKIRDEQHGKEQREQRKYQGGSGHLSIYVCRIFARPLCRGRA